MTDQPPWEAELDRKLNDAIGPAVIAVGLEQDRGAVLVACALIEKGLKDLIESVFRHETGDKRKNELFGGSGFLGSLSARLNAVYHFRMIDRETYEAISALRLMRNDLAHGFDAFQIRDYGEKISTAVAALRTHTAMLRGVAARAVDRISELVASAQAGVGVEDLKLPTERAHIELAALTGAICGTLAGFALMAQLSLDPSRTLWENLQAKGDE